MRNGRVFFCGLLVFLTSDAFAAEARNWGVTALIGVPHPINLAVDHRLSDKWSVGATGGALSVRWPNLPLTIGISNIEGRGRWHPFSGSFILGGVFGYHSVAAKAQDKILVGPIEVPTTIRLNIKALYFTPHLGWYWTWGSGFTLGFEFGVQLPFGPSSSFDVSIDDPVMNYLLTQVKQTADYKTLEGNLEKQANQVGKLVLPYVTVLRLGWAF